MTQLNRYLTLPGDLLFEVRLSYEDLVETQTAYLKKISELEVERREIARLEEATQSGAISGKQLLDRRYAKEKLEAFAKSQREALRLHGLSDRQVDAIGTDGKLLRDVQIVAPDVDQHDANEELRLSNAPMQLVSFAQSTLPPPSASTSDPDTHEHKPLVIEDLQVQKGQAITAGERMCTLSDYTQLYIEGKAFENDVRAISQAVYKSHTELPVYGDAFDAAMEVFKLSKSFPKEETYSLTDQIRRSSRSVCANVAEAWRKRRSEAFFVSTLNISEAEAAETQVWLQFAVECQYLQADSARPLYVKYDEVLSQLVHPASGSQSSRPL